MQQKLEVSHQWVLYLHLKMSWCQILLKKLYPVCYAKLGPPNGFVALHAILLFDPLKDIHI
jgi:hypothetical protein